MKTLTVRKLYIDSRYLSTGDSSSFEYELPETVELPKDTVAYVTEFTCVNGWDTINSSNQHFYIVEGMTPAASKGRRLTLAHKPHDSETLRLDLQSALNSGKTVDGTYSVERVPSAGNTSTSNLAASYRYFRITLGGGGQFKIPTEAELASSAYYADVWRGLYNGDEYSTSSPSSTNELFRFTMNNTFASSATSGFVDLRSKHSLFVHSPSFGNYTSIGPRGVRTILQKIPVRNAYGGLTIYEHSGHPSDYIEVSSTTIRTMQFELRDARGNFVDLHGGHWSMTIVFAERPN